ncbi:MAG TPA: hypothetical protein VL990_10875 [Acidobacteriaceae bacterium]|nr:hypothetical protein [Acidobacteriaceae bacterium]
MPIFGSLAIPRAIRGEDDTNPEAPQQNDNQEPELSRIHGVPGKECKRCEEGDRKQFAFGA